jgi:glycosyltransferase involved in cell wall biosynthesis
MDDSPLPSRVPLPSTTPATVQATPRVTIGLAVYNGEEFLAEAIESILGQTFTDFVLVICDNASTDSTGDICRKFASIDDRIDYHRNLTNIGGVNNETLTFKLSRSELFRLAAHDDVWEPDLLRRCVDALDSDPGAVLAYTATTKIDEHGVVLGVSTLGKGTSPHSWKRFSDFPWRDHDSETTYGLMRSEVVRQVRPQGNYGHSDRVWLSELALRGRFVEISEPLFKKRYHPKNVYVDIRARIAWFNPEWRGRVSLPYWQELVNYVRVIDQAPVSRLDKLRCVPTVVRWTFRFSKNLAKDLAVAVWMTLGPGRRTAQDDQRYNWN